MLEINQNLHMYDLNAKILLSFGGISKIFLATFFACVDVLYVI